AREFDTLLRIVTEIVSMNAKKPHETIQKINQSILQQMEHDLETNSFGKKTGSTYEEELSRISLFKSIFQEDLDNMKDFDAVEVRRIFHSKFPQELVEVSKYMEVFSQIGR